MLAFATAVAVEKNVKTIFSPSKWKVPDHFNCATVNEIFVDISINIQYRKGEGWGSWKESIYIKPKPYPHRGRGTKWIDQDIKTNTKFTVKMDQTIY